MDAEEETVYQYWTIVSDSDEFLRETDDGDLSFGDSDKIMYLSLGEETKEEDDDEVEVTFPSSEILQSDDMEDGTNTSNIKFILEDGQMYMADGSNLGETFTSVDPDLMSTNADEEEDDESPIVQDDAIDMGNFNKNETVNSDNEGDYRPIQLEDGTCAYIDKSLWHSLIDDDDEDDCKHGFAVKKKKFPCLYYGCNKVYTTAHHLTVHVRNHTGNRPYGCTVAGCGKAFATGYSLKAHLRTHTGEAPYSCSVCPKQFKTSGDLQKHTRTHTGEKPFKCPIEGCGRSFTTSNIRKVHIRSHTGERPYACTYADCGKAFASATNYKNHMRIHSGEKPYECTVQGCGKRFTEYSSLFKHNAVHKPFKALKCEYCDQLCKHESTLKSHKQAVHQILFTRDGTEIRFT